MSLKCLLTCEERFLFTALRQLTISVENLYRFNKRGIECYSPIDLILYSIITKFQEVEIKDKRLDSSTFEIMLFFIYSAFGEIKLTKESVWNILYAGS